MAIRCFRDLLQFGAEQELVRAYGPYIVEPEPGYDFSITIDLDNLPPTPGLSSPTKWHKQLRSG